MIFSEPATLRAEDFGNNGLVTLDGILRLFEDIADHHSRPLGDSPLQGLDKPITWILMDWHLELVTPIPYGADDLTVSTWARDLIRGGMTPRDYSITGADGTVYVRATSTYALFDRRAGKMVRVTHDALAPYQPEPAEHLSVEPAPRLREPKEYQMETVVPLRRSDFDFNRHVHNLNYLTLAFEGVPQEVYDADWFSSLRILYRKGITGGAAVTVKYARTEGGHVVGVYGEDGVLSALVELGVRK